MATRTPRFHAQSQLATRLRAVLARRPEQWMTISRALVEAVVARLDVRRARPCAVCGALFLARADGVTCSSACRQKAFRRRRKGS